MKKFLFYIVLIVLAGCGNQKQTDTESKKQESSKKEETKKVEAVVSDDSTMTVRENRVIFFWPDSKEIEEMQANNPEDVYNEIVADLTWYPGIAGEDLDTLNIKHEICDREFLILVKSDKTEMKLKRKETKGNMILFNVDKEPIISYAISFDKQEVIEYYNLK
jgi:hypothetical protein